MDEKLISKIFSADHDIYSYMKYLINEYTKPCSKYFNKFALSIESGFYNTEYIDIETTLIKLDPVKSHNITYFFGYSSERITPDTAESLVNFIQSFNKGSFTIKGEDSAINDELNFALLLLNDKDLAHECAGYEELRTSCMKFNRAFSKLRLLVNIVIHAKTRKTELSNYLPTINSELIKFDYHDWFRIFSFYISSMYFYYLNYLGDVDIASIYGNKKSYLYQSLIKISLQDSNNLFVIKKLQDSLYKLTGENEISEEALAYRRMIKNLNNNNSKESYIKCKTYLFKRFDEVRKEFSKDSHAAKAILDDVREYAKRTDVNHKDWHSVSLKTLQNTISKRKSLK